MLERPSNCQQLLKANRTQLDALAQRLLEREVISGDELKGYWASAGERRLVTSPMRRFGSYCRGQH